MTSPSKTKGDRCELALTKYLAEWWPNVRRGKAGAEADLGDIFNVVDGDGDAWTVQVADRNWKAYGQIEAKARDAAEQSERAGTPFWVLVVKRAGCADPGRWFVYLPSRRVMSMLNNHVGAAQGVLAEDHPFDDLACLTVRSWVALVAPVPGSTR